MRDEFWKNSWDWKVQKLKNVTAVRDDLSQFGKDHQHRQGSERRRLSLWPPPDDTTQIISADTGSLLSLSARRPRGVLEKALREPH
jgi:hypothetical protein